MSRRARKARAATAETTITADVEPAVRHLYGIHAWARDGQYQRTLPRAEEVEIYHTPRPVKKTSRLTLEAMARTRLAQEEALSRDHDEARRRIWAIAQCRRTAETLHAVYQRRVVDGWTFTDVAAYLLRQGIRCDRDRVREDFMRRMRAEIRRLYRVKYGYEASPEFPVPPITDEEEERAEA